MPLFTPKIFLEHLVVVRFRYNTILLHIAKYFKFLAASCFMLICGFFKFAFVFIDLEKKQREKNLFYANLQSVL